MWNNINFRVPFEIQPKDARCQNLRVFLADFQVEAFCLKICFDLYFKKLW